jgi:hypothetical protein
VRPAAPAIVWLIRPLHCVSILKRDLRPLQAFEQADRTSNGIQLSGNVSIVKPGLRRIWRWPAWAVCGNFGGLPHAFRAPLTPPVGLGLPPKFSTPVEKIVENQGLVMRPIAARASASGYSAWRKRLRPYCAGPGGVVSVKIL